MTMILTAAVMGSWTYAGFLTESTMTPAPDPVPTQSQTLASLDPTTAKTIEEEPVVASPPLPDVSAKAPTTHSTVPAPSVAASPRRFRLTDASGQTWEHGDAIELASFVDARNRMFATYSLASPATFTYFPGQAYRSSGCPHGQCP